MRVLSILLGAGVIGALGLAFSQASGQSEPYQDPPPPLTARADPSDEPDEAMPENPHAGMGKKNPHAFGASAHPAAEPSAPVPVGKVEKAKGPTARRVAELFAQKKALEGKPVRVRGVVVKSMSGVLGKTFMHLRDGSGDEKSSNNDVTVTTDAEVKVGDTITVEGSVVTNKDFGAGYRYDVIIEQAKLVSD